MDVMQKRSAKIPMFPSRVVAEQLERRQLLSVSVSNATARPLAPSSLEVVARSATQILINWKDTTTNETEFELDRSTDGIHFSEIKRLPANTTSFIDGSLTPNTKYWYR